MGFFDKFPYSNPYQLNLDWLIAQMKKFEADYNQLDPDSFLRKSGGLVNGMLQMDENGSIDMSGKPLTGLKIAVNSGDALSFGQAEGRYLRKTGGKMSGILDMDGNAITNIPAPVADSDAVNKKFVEDKIGTPEAPGAYLPLAGGMMSGDINMDGHSLTGIQNPVNGLDAVNKTYLDGINGAIRQWAIQQFATSGLIQESVTVASEAELDNIISNRFAAMSAQTVKYFYVYASATFFGGSRAIMSLEKVSASDANVLLYVPHTNGVYVLHKAVAGTSIQPLEWENPPMVVGVEYRTVERHNGKVVYAQYLKVGTAVNGGSMSMPSGATSIIRHQGYIGTIPMPIGSKYIERSGYFAYTASRTDGGIHLLTDSLTDGYGSGGYNWFEQMWYTK